MTVTATVDRVDRSSRIVTFRAEGNALQSVYVDPKVTEFDNLKSGDVVTVRYVEAVIVQVNPNAKGDGVRDTTEEAKKAGAGPGDRANQSCGHDRGHRPADVDCELPY